jgi:hypothetical protein
MAAYYMNEAMLELSGRSLVDRTVHELEVVTDEGAPLRLAILRRPLDRERSLAEQVGELVAEAERKLRGFSLLSVEEREAPEVVGVEVRLRHREDGEARFQHQFHCAVGDTWLSLLGASSMADGEACDRWMTETVTRLRLRT